MDWSKDRGAVTIVGTADSHWGNYFIANETEQGNEELVCLNRSPSSFPTPLPSSQAQPCSWPLLPSSPLLTFVPTGFSVTASYSFLLAAAVQQFFLFLKYSSWRAAAAVADKLSCGSENANTLFPVTALVCWRQIQPVWLMLLQDQGHTEPSCAGLAPGHHHCELKSNFASFCPSKYGKVDSPK